MVSASNVLDHSLLLAGPQSKYVGFRNYIGSNAINSTGVDPPTVS